MLNKLTTQHKWILILLAIILVNVAAWMYGLRPAVHSVEATRAELNQAQQRRDRIQTQLEQLEAIDTDALTEEWEAVNPRVPDQSFIREFIHGLVDLSDEMGMPLPSVSISAPVFDEPYFTVTLNTSISGTYNQLKSFLIALEQYERLILVRIYSFSGTEDSLTCSLSMSIYAENFEHLTPFEATGRDNPFRER